MLADNVDGDRQRDGDERARNAPDPAPERQGDEDRHGRDREALALQHRVDEVADRNLQDRVADKYDGGPGEVLELRESIERGRNDADDVAHHGNEVQQKVQEASHEREVEADREGPERRADPGDEARDCRDTEISSHLCGDLIDGRKKLAAL